MFPLKRRDIREGREPSDNPLARFRQEMENLLDRFTGSPFSTNWMDVFRGGEVGPRLDVSESANEITVRAELPAIKPEDVDVDISGNILTIRGEKKEEHQERQRNYIYSERQFGSFSRSVPLPSSVDPNEVDAAYKDGILTVRIAKRAEARPKRIPIRATGKGEPGPVEGRHEPAGQAPEMAGAGTRSGARQRNGQRSAGGRSPHG